VSFYRESTPTKKDVIQEIVQGLDPNDQQRYINKLYAVAV